MKETTIMVPEGATSIKVKIDGDNYPLILVFDDGSDTHHFWVEEGKYDGHSSACLNKEEAEAVKNMKFEDIDLSVK